MEKPPIELDVVRHARLLGLFVRRELKARYVGSLLGVFWSVVHPLLMLLLYIIVFSTLVPRSGRLPFRSATAEYAVFLCPALLAWNWLHETLMGSVNSIVANASIIRKTVFPLSLLPCVPMIASGVAFVVAMAAFFVFLGVAGHGSWTMLLGVPPLALLQMLLLLGPAYLLAAANVFFRDTAQILFAVLQVLFWATPIVYPPEVLTKLSPFFEWWFRFNPMARLVDCYRQVIIVKTSPDVDSLLYVTIVAILLYHLGRSAFMRGYARFVDEV